MSYLERAITDGHAKLTGQNLALLWPNHTARNWQIQPHPNNPTLL